MNIFVLVLVPAAIALLGWSALKDRKKTKRSLEVAKGMFLNVGGEIFGLLLLVALFFTLVPQGAIESLLGGANIFLSSVYGAIMGTILILPKFVALPMAADLIEQGAHIVVAAGFITTLTMVGFATAPVEIEHFGKKYTLVRNVLGFIFALLIAIGMMVLL
ncbi:permease [candidate division MSBL1 archaeon SCGC-AAA382A03]|uniref:Permease n=1 Tax=candidate division MSBL1 archaeon SCGC-AAA382A03 TaxID=1698278 RepID=A0A133VFJ5_9EURY|nr:permease [candidate division MSBL1 archaeon SCGC-AAA382A03]